MRYYQHHIGDFNNATRHLTRIERSIYRDLIEFYYDIEKQLPLDISEICRKIIAVDESTTVERMLNEFFTKTPDGWYHDRCELEIEKYLLSNNQKSAAGRASAEKRALKKQRAINGSATNVEIPFNGNATEGQLTINHEPLTINQNIGAKKRASKKCPPDFVVSDEMREWAKIQAPSVNVDKATDSFKDHTFSSARTDWVGTWRNWIRKANDYAKPTKSHPPRDNFSSIDYGTGGKL